MDLKLHGKNVLVTGAGKDSVRPSASPSPRKAPTSPSTTTPRPSAPRRRPRRRRRLGVQAIAVAADLTDSAAVTAAVEEVKDRLGAIDILINNSAATQSKPFLETTEEDWAPQIGVTVTGTLRVTQAVAKQMVEAGVQGSIVSLMGDSGRVGESRLLVTATTRSTTVGLTKSLAKELARHKIRANAVSIALVQTGSLAEHTGNADDEKMKRILSAYPLRRLGTPDDVTPTILLLASDLSSWTTGQILSVNGGYAMP